MSIREMKGLIEIDGRGKVYFCRKGGGKFERELGHTGKNEDGSTRLDRGVF